jgi:hypothetical protein
MFGCTEWRKPWLVECVAVPGVCHGAPAYFETSKFMGVGTRWTGEEEVKDAKSEAPVTTGVWCNRERLRNEAE